MPKRHSYTVEFKLNALERVIHGESIKSVAKDIGVQTVRIREWRDKEAELILSSRGVAKK